MDTHVWSVNGSNRCMFCGVNDLDNDIYGPYVCVEREPLVWTSESGLTPAQSNPEVSWNSTRML
jgi:hypothetical protein